MNFELTFNALCGHEITALEPSTEKRRGRLCFRSVMEKRFVTRLSLLDWELA